MTKMKVVLFLWLGIFFAASSGYGSEKIDYDTLRKVPVLHQGRVKPLDTVARESVQSITGKLYFQGSDPLETFLGWFFKPEEAFSQPVLLIRYIPLKERIGIDPNKNYVSPEELSQNQQFELILQNVATKSKKNAALDSIEEEAERLYSRAALLRSIVDQSILAIFPSTQKTLVSASSPEAPSLEKEAALMKLLKVAFKNRQFKDFQEASKDFATLLSQKTSSAKITIHEKELALEVQFNAIRPFQKAAYLFVAAFVLLLLSFTKISAWFYRSALFLAFVGLSLSVYGFVARMLISDRPPVTNMYESVIWVSFGVVFFALIFEAIYRSRYFLLVASGISSVGFILADNLPNFLNPNIQPLTPVLRSNFWLSIHVLTITLSYAALTLAMGIGQASLGFFAFKPNSKETLKKLTHFHYRVIQVGVILLTAGTILGGVWANYSWGRFWGWDPKEVGALVALLGYLTILHGRYTGWVNGLNLAIFGNIAYLLVLMAWYGVNIMGKGLHSYGFSKGGLVALAAVAIAQITWTLAVFLKTRKKSV